MKKIQAQTFEFKRTKPLPTLLVLGFLTSCTTTNEQQLPSTKQVEAQSSEQKQTIPQADSLPALTQSATPNLVCHNAKRFAGRKIGKGHCVSLIRHCTQAPFTSAWRPGEKVLGTALPAGTIIATFQGQRYPSRRGYHAAIYIEQDTSGIWVWDQWRGKGVHKRLIRVRSGRADPGNTAQAYRVVRVATIDD